MDREEVVGADGPILGKDNNHLPRVDFQREKESSNCELRKRFPGIRKRLCNLNRLQKKVPVLSWIKRYNLSCLMGDIVAGFTVGLMIIPQALAYGIVAGLTPADGMYSSIAGGLGYFLFGSTHELSVGPTAITALMTYEYSSEGGVPYAVLLCFLSGAIEILAGVINLGFLIHFISEPVISGFTSAAALTIASSQLKSLFAIRVKTRGLLDTWIKVGQNIGETRWQDLTLGLCCILFLIFMKEIRSMKCKCLESLPSKIESVLRKVIFFFSVGRNALVVMIATLIARLLDGENQPFILTGPIKPGLPSFAVPAFSAVVNNQTKTFETIVYEMGIGIVTVPFISILSHIAVVSAMSKGKFFDPNQEIFALGFINLLGSFFGSFPCTGSLSRTAVNKTSGVRTPAGGLVTTAIVLMALVFLTPFFQYIPKSTLAAVIICAVLQLFDYEIILPLWRTKRLDLLPLAVTFVACLCVGLELGILIGIALNLAIIVLPLTRPKIKLGNLTLQNGLECIYVQPMSGLPYPGTSHFRTVLQKAGIFSGEGTKPVVVNGANINSADFTSAKGIKGTVDDFEDREQSLIFVGLDPKIRKTISSVATKMKYCDALEDLEDILNQTQT